MNTRKDLTNISYNSPLFLKNTLERLKDKGYLEFWYFIEHKPENNEDKEANKKKHIHLFIRPAKTIQTLDLGKEFFELNPLNPKKPLKCTDDWHICQKGHFGDAYLYDLHDIQYLKHKGIEREYHYNFTDIICSDIDTLERMISFIDLGTLYRQEIIMAAIDNGWSYKKAMANGVFGEKPNAYAAMYRAMLDDHYREVYEAKKELDRKYYKEVM